MTDLPEMFTREARPTAAVGRHMRPCMPGHLHSHAAGRTFCPSMACDVLTLQGMLSFKQMALLSAGSNASRICALVDALHLRSMSKSRFRAIQIAEAI